MNYKGVTRHRLIWNQKLKLELNNQNHKHKLNMKVAKSMILRANQITLVYS